VPELTVVSFNTHAGVGPRRFDRDEYDLVGVLRAFDADVIVLQESWTPDEGDSAVDKAAAELGAEVHELPTGRAVRQPWPHIARSGAERGTVGVAVVTRFPAERVGVLPLGPTFADPSPRRGALHLRLDVEGTPLDLVALHLTSRLPHGPLQQLWRLRHQLPPRGRPAVVAGDHNLWGPGVLALLPGWRRAVRGRTWPAHRPHSQIDHILVRPEIEVLEGEVLPPVGSDHRPVRARLRLG